MSVEAERLKERTEQFVLDAFELMKRLPTTEPGPTIRKQLSKSATSVAANYRAACRARSHAEFTAKIGQVAEEADETFFWLQLLAKAGLMSSDLLVRLQQEARELLSIFSASVGTARRNEQMRRRHGSKTV